MSYDYRASEDEYIPIGPVCRQQLGMQAQYGSRYLKDPVLGKDIRWRGGHAGETYHDIQIHRDDVKEFVARVNAHRRANGEIR